MTRHKTKSLTPRAGSTYNVARKSVDLKHLFIRLAILIVVPTLTFIAVALSIRPHNPRMGNPMMGAVVLAFMEIAVMGIWLAVETIVLHLRRRTRKRNADLLLMAAFLLVCLVSWLFNS